MRAAGVPARVVTGYQGGELNPVDGYLGVRQSDAHAWAEVWLEKRGWVRVDPTAVSVPSRIEQNLAAAVPAGEPLPFLARVGLRLAARAALPLVGRHQHLEPVGARLQPANASANSSNRLGMHAPDWRKMTATLAGAVPACAAGAHRPGCSAPASAPRPGRSASGSSSRDVSAGSGLPRAALGRSAGLRTPHRRALNRRKRAEIDAHCRALRRAALR